MIRMALLGLASLALIATAAQAADTEATFLANAAKQPGAVTLPGLTYVVRASGPKEGAHPNRADTVTVRYVGRFMDGKVFNTSPNDGKDTTTFELGKLIPGWVGAVRLMRPGDRWTLYVPSWLAYGSFGKSPYIPPDATLIFDVELVSITPAPPPPPSPPKSAEAH